MRQVSFTLHFPQFGCLGAWVLAWVLGCLGARVLVCRGVKDLVLNDILDGQKGDQGGGQKMAKILGGVKFQQFRPPLRPRKCF